MALTDNILAYWKFDDGSGTTAADATGNGHTGTLSGSPAPTWNTSGIINDSLTYNGTTAWVSVADAAALSPTAITVAAWVNFSSFPNAYNTIVSKITSGASAYWQYHVKSNGKLDVYLTASGGSVFYDGTGSHTLLANTWYFVVFTYDSTNGLIGYVNAASDATVAANGTLKATTGAALAIGNDTNTAGRFPAGKIDEVGVWSRALTSTEITELYNSGAGLQYPFNSALSMSVSDSVSVSEEIGLNQTITVYSYTQTPTSNWAFLEDSASRGIARDSAGNLYAVANAYNPSTTYYSIRIFRSTDNGNTWTQQSLYSYSSGSAFAPKIAIDSSDNFHVVFEAYGATNNPTINNIGYVHGTWASFSSVTWLTDSSVKNYTPAIAIDQYDTKHITWNGYNTTVMNVRYLSIDSSQVISSITELTNYLAGGCNNPDIAVDGNNNVVVIFFSNSSTTYGYYEVRSIVKTYSTGLWGSVTSVSINSGGNLFYASLAIDASNNYYTSFNAQVSPNNEIQIFKSTDGGSTWSSFQTFTLAGVQNIYSFSSMAFDSVGNFYIAYSDGTMSTPVNPASIRYNKYNGTSWGTQMIIGSSQYFQVRPNMVYAIWPKSNAQPSVPKTGSFGMWLNTLSTTSDQTSNNIDGWRDLDLAWQSAGITLSANDSASLSESAISELVDFVKLTSADTNAGGDGWVWGAKIIG